MEYKNILTKKFLQEEYWKKRESARKIAKKIDCSKKTIVDYLIKHNIPRRNLSEAHKGKHLSWEHRKNIGLANIREKNYFWKGGKFTNGKGYILIHSPQHPFRDCRNYVFEHRLIIEKYLKRYLKSKETIHHINGIKNNNCPENLMAFSSKSAHQRFHRNLDNVKSEEIIFDGRILFGSKSI